MVDNGDLNDLSFIVQAGGFSIQVDRILFQQFAGHFNGFDPGWGYGVRTSHQLVIFLSRLTSGGEVFLQRGLIREPVCDLVQLNGEIGRLVCGNESAKDAFAGIG